ncbi:MAG: polyamine aminopropyltransferase [Methylophilaceae bacterium]|nr:polyamine aminopropyltransferase [Methylophilaceae bacterium]
MFGRGTRRPGRFFHRHQAPMEMATVDISEKDGVRALHLGSVTVQSAMRVSAPFELELAYSRGVMAFLLFRQDARDVLVLGLGGGSIPKYIHRYLPSMRVTAVELNPAVVTAARHYFYLPEDDDRLRVEIGDGAAYVRDHPGCTDVLVVDAFDAKGLVADFATQAFYDCCHDVLRKDGLLVVNLWGSDKNFDVYLKRIETSFQSRVLMLPTGRPGNILVFAFKDAPAALSWAFLRRRAAELQQSHRIEFLEFVERFADHHDGTLINMR